MTATLPPPPGAAATRPAPQLRSVQESLRSARDDSPQDPLRGRIPTGFDPLDRVLDGGLRPHELVLLGGSPGVGKTAAALQFARHAAETGRMVLYLSYEHGQEAMLGRLLALELGELRRHGNLAELERLRAVVIDAAEGVRSLDEVVDAEPLVAEACERVGGYGERLLVLPASGSTTDLGAISRAVEDAGIDTGGLLVVDYLQRVAVAPAPVDEDTRVTRVSEGLKGLALTHDLAVVAVVASDWDGLRTGRVRLHHLRGSSALAYECDVAVLMNEKWDAVSRVHLAYDAVRAETFKHQVVFSVEKNRGGPAMVDIEHRKDLAFYRFDPQGSYMLERATDDRLEPR